MSDWVEYVVAEGRAARKWFSDHYKEVHVAPDGDLDAATAAVDAEVAGRALGAEQQAAQAAADLRAAADVVDPAVEQPAEAPAPAADNAEA